jgi:putative hydrolase of the HAD superfamily
VTKPDVRFYEQLTSRCDVDPQECIMVGDRIDKDIIPAKVTGMKTIRVRVGIHSDQEPRVPSECPDRTLSSVAGLAYAVLSLSHEYG